MMNMNHKVNRDKFHMVGDLEEFLLQIIFGKLWLGLVLLYSLDHMLVL